jgi:hypothetical protein
LEPVSPVAPMAMKGYPHGADDPEDEVKQQALT